MSYQIVLDKLAAFKSKSNRTILEVSSPVKATKLLPKAYLRLDINWDEDRQAFEIFLKVKPRYGTAKTEFITHSVIDQPFNILKFDIKNDTAFFEMSKQGDVPVNDFAVKKEYKLGLFKVFNNTAINKPNISSK